MSELPEGWVETTLGEVAENISRRFDFSKVEEVIFVNTGDVLDGKYLHNNFSKKEGLPGQAKKAIIKGDILFSEIRPANKRFAKVDFDADHYVVSTKFMVIKKNEKIHFDFLYILLTSINNLQKFQIAAESRSGTFPQITFDAVSYFPINLPPLPEQKNIAKVLSVFDEKIELLREQNETVETIAQTIFKEWFVHFNYPGATGEMVDSELGEIPKGWRVGKLGDVTNIRGGGTPSTKNINYWNGDIHWTSPKDLSNAKSTFLLDTEKKITEKGLNKISSGLLPEGTLLLSSRAPIGYLAISNIKIAINQGYIALLNNSYLSNHYMYLWLKKNMKAITNAANGSTFLEINKTSFKDIVCIVPDSNSLKEFDVLMRTHFDKILLNQQQIQTLSKTRDTLLPKLMSGELRVAL